MHKSNHYTYRKSFVIGKFLIVLMGAIILLNAPTVYASELIGTETIGVGSKIYKAVVSEGETYTNVFGIKGGYSESNHYGLVEINKGTVNSTVYGCRAISGENVIKSSFNIVNLTESNVGNVYGGYAYGGSNNASVHMNNVNIAGGNVLMYVYGGNADGSTIAVTGNKVNITSGATIGKTVYGGCAFNTDSWLSMLRNEVVIDSSTVKGSVYGGYASGSNTASNNNIVTIKEKSTINGSVYGGYALSSNSDAKNNIVKILGGTINNHIYGGVGRNATGNTIILEGGCLQNADLYGYSDGRKSHSANTLEVWTPEKVKSAQNFERYVFVVSQDVLEDTGKFMLTTQTPVNLSGTNVCVAIKDGANVSAGKSVNLIYKVESSIADCESLQGKELKGGSSFQPCDFILSIDENGALIANITKVCTQLSVPNKEIFTKETVLLGGQIAALALLGEGNDLALDMAISDAETAVDASQNKSKNITAFLTISGGKSHYYASTHINMLSDSLITGISTKISKDKADSLLGIYFEAGNSDYLSFSTTEEEPVFGEGISQYNGLGVMLQTSMLENRALYLQTIGRIGSIDNNWDSDSFSYKVNTSHLYFGSSFGIGYKGNIANNFGYEAFGKFMWTQQNGCGTYIESNQLEFDDINLLKTRLGAKIDYSGEKLKAFLSLAWEKQLNERASATIKELYTLETSGLVGNIGLLELAASYKPKDNWQFDITATGYIGVRKGLKGSALVSLSF